MKQFKLANKTHKSSSSLEDLKREVPKLKGKIFIVKSKGKAPQPLRGKSQKIAYKDFKKAFINVNGHGQKIIKDDRGKPLLGGDLKPGQVVKVYFKCEFCNLVCNNGPCCESCKACNTLEAIKKYKAEMKYDNHKGIFKFLKYDPNAESTFAVAEKMINYGGSFVATLGSLYMHSDRINKIKILNTWENYFDYSEK